MTKALAMLLLAASLAVPVTAGARELPVPATAPAQGTCELTCQSRVANGGMSTRVECTGHMDARQCTAIADHRNLNDAYPVNFNCSARIVESCTESRK